MMDNLLPALRDVPINQFQINAPEAGLFDVLQQTGVIILGEQHSALQKPHSEAEKLIVLEEIYRHADFRPPGGRRWRSQ